MSPAAILKFLSDYAAWILTGAVLVLLIIEIHIRRKEGGRNAPN